MSSAGSGIRIRESALISEVWDCRHFWTHLALADLRARYRRSYLGLMWSALQPALLTVLLAFVMGRLFGQSMWDYAPFVLSGLIVWEYLVQTCLVGSTSFISAEIYIKQYPHPNVIYPLRVTLYTSLNSGVALIGLLAWCATLDTERHLLALPSLALGLVVIILVGMSLATCAAYAGVRYRDLPQVLQLLFQALWYTSTVFIRPEVFEGAGVAWLVTANPVNGLLELVRGPLLVGQPPTARDWLLSLLVLMAFAALATLLVRRGDRSVIWYL